MKCRLSTDKYVHLSGCTSHKERESPTQSGNKEHRSLARKGSESDGIRELTVGVKYSNWMPPMGCWFLACIHLP